MGSQRLESETSERLALRYRYGGLPQGGNLARAPVEDCAIRELFVWQMAQHLVCCLLAQKFTFGEAGITDRADIFIC